MIQKYAEIAYNKTIPVIGGVVKVLYDQNTAERLEKEIFENPPAAFRGAPFWAWNAELNPEELLWQIDRLKEMGFGGFFMHSRSGMATKYLSREFLDLVKACIRHGKETGMLSYLYDEDRWSSGSAGGYATRKKEYRQKTICLSRTLPEEMEKRGKEQGREPQLLAAYEIYFDENDRLDHCRFIDAGELTAHAPEGLSARAPKASSAHAPEASPAPSSGAPETWYLYMLLKPPCGWHNGYTYLDTMNADAVDTFIDITYETYKKEVGEEFGKNIPAIFTDEPNYGVICPKEYARDGKDAELPWTQTFRVSFEKRFGYDILERLPEVIWNKKDDAPATARYHYYAHASELFARAYNDRIGKWCAGSKIAFTGHMLKEDSLSSQMSAVGEAMRQYRSFTIPGIDMLCNETQFMTAKQAQSVAHQCGREGVMSELYGVTGWDFDFRGHKFQGDWQAALGVTLRVPHLSWFSMRGSAKRDYPASIGYQSSWFREYGFIENHFARVNTALTRGVPEVKVAVLHPIESSWLAEGVREHTAALSGAMNERFMDLIQWLLRGQIDFDLVSESLLAELYDGGKKGFGVGQMEYQVVLAPPLLTIRATTIKALAEFLGRGGRVIVTGKAPACVDGQISGEAQALYEQAENAAFLETDILDALREERQLAIYSQCGERRRDLLYQMRREGEKRWLFIAHCDPPQRVDGRDCAGDRLRIAVKGAYRPTLYDTMSGEIRPLPGRIKNGSTIFSVCCYTLDSFLFLLTPEEKPDILSERERDSGEAAGAPVLSTSEGEIAAPEKKVAASGKDTDVPEEILPAPEKKIAVPDFVEYKMSEPNVMVLDQCQWSWDGQDYHPREEILRIDKAVRQELGYPLANGEDVQPWCIPAKEPSVFVYLRFLFDSEGEAGCRLGYEWLTEAWLNGRRVGTAADGYYVDKAIHTLALPPLKKGRNELVLRVPVSERISIENFFLTGDFGVRAAGAEAGLTARPRRLAFGSVTGQGMPFYGGTVTYRIPFACEAGELTVRADYYKGALISARLDGREAGKIVLPPYTLTVPEVSAGEHLLELTLYASRINTFGALHLCVPVSWKGPNMWYTDGCGWAYEYQLTDIGIMKKPELTIRPRQDLNQT